MSDFFRAAIGEGVASPNGRKWWHHMPLPGGGRIQGANADPDHQLKMWRAIRAQDQWGLDGKSVLDIGANDGYFTLAALMAGARNATAINSDDWAEYPHNLLFASEAWGVRPAVVTADFRTHPFQETFDVIFFFGVLYHLENVFDCMKLLRRLLNDQGVLYVETQMTTIRADLPIFENASDIYPTTVNQYKEGLDHNGLSNYLLPNEHAMRNLAHSYAFSYECLDGPDNEYTRTNPDRKLFRMVRLTEGRA